MSVSPARPTSVDTRPEDVERYLRAAQRLRWHAGLEGVSSHVTRATADLLAALAVDMIAGRGAPLPATRRAATRLSVLLDAGPAHRIGGRPEDTTVRPSASEVEQ